MAVSERDLDHAAGQDEPVVERLWREMEELGLPPYQARALAALLRARTANSIQLAKLSGVPRTSTYQVMEALTAQGLVERVPTIGPAVWTCHGWETVGKVLEAAGQDRLRRYQDQLQRVARALAEIPSESPPEPVDG